MKLIAILLMFCTLPAVHAEPHLNSRIFSTMPRLEEVASDLSFKAAKIKVVHWGWYNSLFEEKPCEKSLSGRAREISLELKSIGPHAIELILDGHASTRMQAVRASFVPQYFKNNVPVREHYLVMLKNGGVLHIAIRKEGGRKTLKLAIVQGRGDDVYLQPIFEAEED